METPNLESKLNEQAINFLKESIEKLEKAMVGGFAAVHAKLEIMADNYVKREELDRAFEPRDEKIKNLEDNQKWIVRIIISSVVVAIMGVILAYK